MGVIRQFGALIWKNYILRKRKPIFLLLEVLWPVFVFVVVALIRKGVPPVSKEACSYQERALPSAGMVPFLQSAACTLENKCYSPSEVAERMSAQEGLRRMLYNVDPYIRKPTTLTAFEVLPTVAKVVNTLKVKLNDTVIKKMDDRLVLKNLVRDEEKIIELLVDEHKLMSEEQARDLFEASVNPLEMLKTLGKIDFKDIACNEEILVKHIVFLKDTDVAAVSQSLCAIQDDLISNITNELVRQLDVANMVRIAEDFANYVGEFDYAVLLSDIADLMEVYLEKSGLLAAITDLPDLTMIPAALNKLSVIIPMMEKLKTVDMQSISSLYELFDPLLETVVDETTMDTIRQTFESLEKWTAPSLDSELDWSSMLNLTKSLMETYNTLANGSLGGIMDALSYSDVESLYEYMASLLNNSTMDPAALARLSEAQYKSMEALMKDFMNETTMNMMMAVSNEAIEMVSSVMAFKDDMDAELRQFVQEDYDSGNLMDTFMEIGPKNTSIFLKEIVKLPNFKKLMTGEVDSRSMCINLTDTLFMEDEDTYNIVMSSLCSVEVTSNLDQVISDAGYEVMLDNMEKSMQEISYMMENPESVVTMIDMKTLNDKVMTMTNDTIFKMMQASREWSAIVWTDSVYQQDFSVEEWYMGWYTVTSEIQTTTVMMGAQMIGESMEGTYMWSQAAPVFIGMDAYMTAMAEPYKLMQDMRDESTTVGSLVVNMEYLPDILPAMMTYMGSGTGKPVMEKFYADPMNSICEEDFLLRLNVSDNVPTEDIKNLICDTNWEEFFTSMMSLLDWMGNIEKRLSVFDTQGTASVDWDQMMHNMYLYMSYTNDQEKVVRDMEYLFEKVNVTKLLMSLEKVDTGMMTNMSFTDMKSTMDSIVPMIQQIDKGLGNDLSFWNFGKHMARAWMAYTNIFNDAMEHLQGSTVNIEEYLMTISPTLGEFYTNMSRKFPKLFEEMGQNLQNPQKLLPGMLSAKWDALCNGTKITELLQLRTTEGVTEFERGLCELNWTVIMEELVSYNPYMQIYIDELTILSGPIDKAPAVDVDWAELMEGSIAFMENLETAYQSQPTQIGGIDVDKLNMTLADFIKTLTETGLSDMSSYAAIVDEMTKLLSQGEHDGNNTFLGSVFQSSMIQLYIQYEFLVFGNAQLHYFNTTNPIDIKKYLNSEEANKLIRMTEVTNQVNAALLANVKDYLTNPKKMTDLLSSNLTGLCEDVNLFSDLFTIPADMNLTMNDLHDTVCGVNINITKLVVELEKSMPGFKRFLNAMSRLEDLTTLGPDLGINVTMVVVENERFSKLIEDLIMNPPNFTVFWSDPEGDMELLLAQLSDFANYTADGFGEQQLASTIGTLQQHLGEALSAVVTSSPELVAVLHIGEAYLQTIENSIIRDQTGLWEDPRVSLADYPEMLKVWELMEMIPEVFETFQYTMIYTSDKLTTTVGSIMEGFDKLCSADPDTLMTVPPTSTFSFDGFMTLLCDINVTVLMEESNSYSGQKTIMDAYASIDNITEPTNITALFIRLDKLYLTLINMGNNSRPTTDMKLPRFLDTKVWEEILMSVEEIYNSSAASMDDNKILEQALYSVDQLQNTVPEIRPFMHLVNEYMAVTDRSMQQTLTMMRDPGSTFMNYPEMRKMWLLLDYLPEIYETYQYTSLIAPDKISNFTATLITGLEALCSADPSSLMTVPPKLDFDFAQFHQDFCAINMTKLLEESMEYNGNIDFELIFSNQTGVVDIKDMGDRINNLRQTIEDLFLNSTATGTNETHLPRFLNATLWTQVMDTVNKRLMDPQIYSQFAYNSNSLLSMLSGQSTPEDKAMLKSMEAAYMIIGNLLDKMDQKQGTNESYKIEDFFASSTELLKLVKLMQRPGLIELLLYSSDNQQFTNILMNENMTAAIINLCTSNWTDMLTVPASVDVEGIKRDFCAIDFTAIEPELIAEFNITHIMDMLASNKSADLAFITEQSERFSQRINSWATSPPMFDLPAHWTNESIWTDMLMKYSESLSTQSQVTNSLKQSLQQLGPLLNQSGVREFGLFIEDLLTMMPDVSKGDNNYTLSDFVQKTPVLQELFKAIELGPEVLDSFLNATITKPRELVKILMTGNVTEIFCSEASLTDLMSLPKTVNVSVITSSFCNFENKSMLDQFAITAGFSDFILGLADKSVNPNWVELASNSEKMFTSFMEFVNKSSSFDVLKMSDAFYYANNTDDLWKLLSVFGALGELGNSTENNETMQFLHTVVEATDVMMGVFENFLDNVEANGNEFSLQSLFLNSSRAMELLNSVEGLDTKTISRLMMARMRPGMEMEFSLALMNTSKMQEMFCGAQTLRKYMILPDTPEMTTVLDAICKATDAEFLQEMEALFNIELLVKTISGSAEGKMRDMQEFSDMISALVERTMNLAANATIEVPFQTLMDNLNVTELLEALMKVSQDLEKDYASVVPGANVFNGLLGSEIDNSTSTVEMIAFLQTWNIWVNQISNKLDSVSGASNMSEILVFGEDLLRILEESSNDSRIVNDIVNMQIIDHDLLLSVLKSDNATERLCGPEFEMIFKTTANSTAQETICGGDRKMVLAEMMLFAAVFEHQYNQQMEIVRNEILKGSLNLSSTDISASTNELVTKLIKFLTEQSNDTQGFSDFYEKMMATLGDLQSSMDQQYTNLIYTWSPIVGQAFMPFMGSREMDMVGAALDVFMDVFIDRLEAFTGDITKEYLLNNNTELTALLESVNAIVKMGAGELSGAIDMTKMMNLIMNPTELQEACERGTFVSLITISGSMSNVSQDFEKLMCMDINTIYTALMNLSDSQSVQDKIRSIFEYESDIAPLDWKALNSKAETLVQLITDKFTITPKISGELAELLNMNNTLEMLYTYMSTIMGMVTSTYLPMNDDSLLKYMDPLIGGISDMFKSFAEKNITLDSLNNPDMLGEFLNALSSLDDHMETYVKNFIIPALEHASSIDQVQEAVCNQTALEAASKTVPNMGIPVDKVINALCGQEGSEWYSRLVKEGLSSTDLVGVRNLLESFFTDTPGRSVSGSWTNVIKSMSDLVEGYMHFFNTPAGNYPVSTKPFDETRFANETLRSVISFMMVMETQLNMEDGLNEIKDVINTVVKVQRYMNTQLEKAKDGNMKINLKSLLPDPESLAKMFQDLQTEEANGMFMLLGIYPEQEHYQSVKQFGLISGSGPKLIAKVIRRRQNLPLSKERVNALDYAFGLSFLNVSLHNMWSEVACDPNKFYVEFSYPPAGFDSEAVRKIMCEWSQSDDSLLNQLLSYVDMGDLLKEISATMDGNSTVVSARENMWNDFWKYSNSFMDNILNIDAGELMSYMETLLKHMGENSLPTSTDSYVASCESTIKQFSGSEYYTDMVLPILNMVNKMTRVSHSSIILGNEMLDVMCVEPASNVTRLVELLKMSSIPEKLKLIAEMLTNDESTFSCESMVNTSFMWTEAFNETALMLEKNGEKYGSCIESHMTMMFEMFGDVTKLFEASRVMLTEVLPDQNFQDFMTAIAGNDEALEVMEYILQGFMQQQNWIEEANEEIKKNMTELEEFLQNTFRMSPNAIESLINATFSKDLADFTAGELVDALCSDSLSQPADDFLANFNSSLREAVGIDCDTDWNTTYEIVSSLITLSKLANKLQDNFAVDSYEWWMGLSADISELASNIQGLSELTGLMDDFSSMDITNLTDSELLSTIQRLLIDNGPDSLIDSLNSMLDRFGQLDNSSHVVFKDIKLLTRGILSFTTLRRLIISNIQIKDFLKNPSEFQQYLIDNIELSAEVAQALVDGSLSFELLINASQEMTSDWVCKPAVLEDLLKSGDNELDYEFLSETFCNLDKDTLISILDEVFKQLDIGDLVEEFLTANIDEILAEAGTTLNETKDAFDALQKANDDLQEAMDLFNDYSANMTNVISVLAQAQIGTASPATLSALLCGSEVGSLQDDFYLTGSLPSVDEESMTPEQRQEREELRAVSPVCENLYLDIMRASGGPIIWGYLKPIIRGKILFSPNNDVTRTIVQEINSTFEMIQDFHEDIKRVASGASSFSNITPGDSTLANLLDSPLVSGFMSQLSENSDTNFEDLIYTLKNTDPELVSAMSNAINFMGDYIQCIELDRFVGFDSEADLEWEAAKLSRTKNLLAGVIFTDKGETNKRKKRQINDDISDHVTYKIRMEIDNVRQTIRLKDRFWRPQAEDQFATEMRYLRGFIQLQDFVDSAIIGAKTGTDGTQFVASTKQFPFPCHKQDTFLNALVAYLLPIMMTFAWLSGLALATYNLVLDREDGQEETLRAMGLVCCLNWWAWFLVTMVMMAFVSVIITIITHYAELLPWTNFAIVFLYFVDFCFSATMMCYFVGAFFTRTSIAILVALIVYFLSYLPYVVLLTLEIEMTFWQKSLACLSSTSAFGFAAQYLARFEEQQIGMQWSNIASSPIPGDEVSFSWCCIMMVIDGAIYLVLGWYIRNVKPGKYGVSEPWYFPISPRYWTSCCGSSSSSDKYRTAEQGDHFEAEASTDPKVISVRGLSKEYKRGKPVVSDLNMDVHAGQVTTLLGHNGAAKTTTMNMLTGILEPTSGKVSIFNRPLDSMRESIGICPQHNALYKYMSVKEHMEFVQSVKSSYSSSSPKDEIRQILEEVNLWHCRNSSVNELSGGMQRRLCVALAFVGGSKAVILDEPTSGVDPSGRRSIWNLIIRKKTAIGVLLSTHHLDEAEVISDKVCILHQGKLLYSGSPLYLKEKFSSGHRVIVERDGLGTGAEDHSPTALTNCIQHFVPGAVLHSSLGREMTFVLPASGRGQFYEMFRTLEEKQGELHVASFGVSDPTLEEVFLTVCQREEDSKKGGHSNLEEEPSPSNGTQGSTLPMSPLPADRHNTEFSWKLQQFSALLVKRFHHYRRNWRLFLSAILLPVILFLAASGLYTIKPDFTQKSLLLSPAIYGPDSYYFIKDRASMDISSVYETFMRNPGLGTTCMDGMKEYRDEYGLKCVDPATDYHVPDFTLNPNATCRCNNFRYSCDKGSPVAPPRERITTTKDILQNLEGRNIENYLFESFDDFIEKRYGGYTFEDEAVGGASDQVKTTVWYNNKGYHSLPSFYSGLSNGILRSRVEAMNKDPTKYGITTFNHPFTFNERQLSEETLLQSAADVGIAVTIMLAFTFIPVGIVMYSVNEYINKEKHLQFISGIGPALYWFTSFFWDLIVLALTTALVVACIAIFRHDAFWARNNTAGVVVLILLYGWATLPLVYCTTKIFNTASTAFLTMFCMLNFIGLIPIFVLFILNFYQHHTIVYDAWIVCQKVFLISPTFALGQGMMDMMSNQIKTSIFARFGTDVYVEPFSFDLLGWNYVFLGIEGVVFFILAVLLDAFSYCNCESSLEMESECYDDEDVAEERQRLQHRRNVEDTLVGKNISKIYKRAGSRFLAVDHVTFGVSRGQCFGLLGINGAGKTTTFKILTGSLEATGGTVYFSEKGRQRDTSLGQNIGYCPQEEALDSFLTVREMLEFYGKMRGLHSDTRQLAISNIIENLELQPICNKTVRTCSGGMKRKLSLAIALLGDPSFVLLDEPTTGMDPVAKRLAWNCIKTAKSKGQTIVLTSHSMEECDVLCSRISILVNGHMKCLGSPQHLKHRFGDTYTIMLHVCGPSARSGKIFELVQSYFPGASIRDHHLDVIQLDIPKQTASVSEIFRVLETEKEHYNILYYTVSQNTLETVFLNFAREQHDSETEGSSDRDSDLTMPTDEESKLTGKPLSNTRFGYMNKAYEGFGEIQYPVSGKNADPEFITVEPDSAYSTNL